MTSYLIVFLGAGIGGALRHAVNVGCARMCGTAFPWGTMTVNIAGSFLMGAIAGYEKKIVCQLEQEVRRVRPALFHLEQFADVIV